MLAESLWHFKSTDQKAMDKSEVLQTIYNQLADQLCHTQKQNFTFNNVCLNQGQQTTAHQSMTTTSK